MRVTRLSIEKAIKEETDIQCQLMGNESGIEGCFYFEFEGYEKKTSTTVYVNRLSCFDIPRWVDEFKGIYYAER